MERRRFGLCKRGNSRIKETGLKLFLYLMRWQCSTLILAPVISLIPNSPWGSAVVANFIGGLLFFYIDMMIFKSKI